MKRYVIYTRVSTAEQKKSGLGLEAQERDIEIFLTQYSDQPFEVLGSFSDTGSGADNGRPEFQRALALVKKTGAELLVSKLDRLSRKVSTIALLMDDPKITFRVASMPHADKFQLHIYAALAEQERDFISKRTKAALDAAKKRGVKLGGYRKGAHEKSNAATAAKANAEASRIAPIVQPMRQLGMSLQAIADALNTQGTLTGLGNKWTATSIKRMISRMKPVNTVVPKRLQRATGSPPPKDREPAAKAPSLQGEAKPASGEGADLLARARAQIEGKGYEQQH